MTWLIGYKGMLGTAVLKLLKKQEIPYMVCKEPVMRRALQRTKIDLCNVLGAFSSETRGILLRGLRIEEGEGVHPHVFCQLIQSVFQAGCCIDALFFQGMHNRHQNTTGIGAPVGL